VENIAVRLDAKGNLYIADANGNRIRKVAAGTGVISTVAGLGTYGFSGDGGLATSAQLNFPNDVAFDGAGNMYIADEYNNRIRRIDAVTGYISTVVGTGAATDTGDGGQGTAATIKNPFALLADPAGNLYMAGNGNQVRKLTVATGIITRIAGTGPATYTGDGGPAVNATLNAPYAMAIDSLGNLFIADGENSVIRRVDAVTGIITTVAGNGTSGFSGDGGQAINAEFTEMYGLAIDSANNIYVADADNNRVRRIDAATGIVTTVAGSSSTTGFAGDGGPATAAKLGYLTGVAFDGAGNLYISDDGNYRVRKVPAGIGVAAFGSYAGGRVVSRRLT
jgi:sugar lactone lactonase YvrE